ncbi:NDR1/HIN1-like protein 6 [Brassica rapa]|uniref:Late embryogenesis abundant protein LEA-2 subgroup domain-containing protein n=1 Tax=Brassica campestris TaxID=3711 RepID=M4DJB5_BRACM|nr:NDR1/HIN1-like protein 6 [Brassica rapa]
MTDDKVYPASKPPVAVNGGTTANPTFPATKAQLYSANRPAYRPPAPRRRTHSRGCCCRCCCWTIFVIILLIVLVAAASAVVYLIYRPQRPSFSVSSLKVSSLNLTSAAHLATAISLSVVARNPNKNVGFSYDVADITVYRVSPGDDDVVIGKGSIASFVHGKKNTTLLKSTVGSPPGDLDELSAGKLKGDLKAKRGVAVKIVLNTKVTVKMGAVKTPKSGIRVTCEGIRAVAPTGKKTTTAVTTAAKCKVDLRFKVWKFTF